MSKIIIKGISFVRYSAEFARAKQATRVNKAALIRQFLQQHADQAFYSTEIHDALVDQGVAQQDVMATLRRAERKRLVYVRGYRTHDQQTPFPQGYLITWIDDTKPRKHALDEAVDRTNHALAHTVSMSPTIQRIHRIHDTVIESTKLRDLASFDFLQNALRCTKHETTGALERTLQLYPEIREVKIFNAFRYFYHASMPANDLHAAIQLKENYIRKVKGRANRIGHNWEAVVGWFIDQLTTGATFWTQRHRSQMDPRRITIHLLKPVGGRRHNAEVDRVWEVTPGPLLQPTTYILECKWGLVQKRHVDDFFNVLRWSKEFGADTPDGRQIKQGITGVFAGSSFDPKESVQLKDESTISLASYAARINIQLLKAVDFNAKLRDRGVVKTVTTQRICRYARDEQDVRTILEHVWNTPQEAHDILTRVTRKNADVYAFEKMLATS
jgi:hypothetical protein